MAYVRSNVEVIAGLMVAAAAEEYDRAAHVRVEENEAMREILRSAAPTYSTQGFARGSTVAAAERDTSLHVSDLNAVNDRLRALLIELQTLGRGARRRLGAARQPCDLGRAPRIGAIGGRSRF